MDPLNIIKIITAIITAILGLVASRIELKKNPEYWLNRWFALFFSSVSIGFLVYTIYHFLEFAPTLIIPLMISAHVLYNFGFISLMMTVFVLEEGEKKVMTKNYLVPMAIFFGISIIGYFIWIPTLNMEQLSKGIVDTETPTLWFIFVNIWRLFIFIFVLFKYGLITRKTEGLVRKRVIFFFIGTVINIIGIILNLIGGMISSPIVEILGIGSFNIGLVFILKGFLLK